MSMDPAIAAMLTQTVSIAVVASRSASGQESWGTPTAMSARVEEEVAEIRNAAGMLVTTSHRIYINGSASPVPVVGARLWLPGTSGSSSARTIHAVHTLPDVPPGTGVDHYEVLI